ncbi:hypothetical protein P12x_002290 [Tundrisphaera lichenicola]|uniref:hypothetical protein n=1 Tax=Tundrisphaera lichenicola TaxID=2029860 RepID=UPI003EBA3BE6
MRSPESPDQTYNIDVVFMGVEKIDIPTMIMSGLEISDPGPPSGESGHSRTFRITADGQQYRIVALACYVFKNQLEFMDSILDLLTGEGFTEEMGDVLYDSANPGRFAGVVGNASL